MRSQPSLPRKADPSSGLYGVAREPGVCRLPAGALGNAVTAAVELQWALSF